MTNETAQNMPYSLLYYILFDISLCTLTRSLGELLIYTKICLFERYYT